MTNVIQRRTLLGAALALPALAARAQGSDWPSVTRHTDWECRD